MAELTNAGLALLVVVVGYLLDRRSRRIEIAVNGRMADALARIAELEHELAHLAEQEPATT